MQIELQVKILLPIATLKWILKGVATMEEAIRIISTKKRKGISI
jgi:hypothetical protein